MKGTKSICTIYTRRCLPNLKNLVNPNKTATAKPAKRQKPSKFPPKPSKKPQKPSKIPQNPQKPSKKPQKPTNQTEASLTKPQDLSGQEASNGDQKHSDILEDKKAWKPQKPSKKPSKTQQKPSEKSQKPSRKPKTPSDQLKKPSKKPQKPSKKPQKPSKKPLKPAKKPQKPKIGIQGAPLDRGQVRVNILYYTKYIIIQCLTYLVHFSKNFKLIVQHVHMKYDFLIFIGLSYLHICHMYTAHMSLMLYLHFGNIAKSWSC